MRIIEVESSQIDTIYETKKIAFPLEDFRLYPNEYFLLKAHNGQSAILRFQNSDYVKLVDPKLQIDKLGAKDKEQLCLIDSLSDETIKLVTCIGPAGSGKTFLTLAWAISEVMKKKELTMILTKPTVAVGDDRFFGPVPGTSEEKFDIFLDSYKLAFEKLFPSRTMLMSLIEREKIQFKPIQFVRGNNWDNTILILDEAQSCNWHSIKSIISRLGENSKAVLLGDIKQKDKVGIGFEQLYGSLSYKESPITSHVVLEKDYRGPLSKLISKIDEEIEKAKED